jgi:hypothetical protein
VKRGPWAPEEVRALKHLLATTSYKEIAAALGRTYSATKRRGGLLGLNRSGAWDQWLRRQITKLNARGLCDAEIGLRLRVHAQTVGKRRRSLGLPRRWLMRRPKAQRMVFARNGCHNLVELRRLHWRVEAQRRGYPTDFTPREIETLELLRTGPRTRPELAQQLGLTVDGTYTMLRRLRERGLLVYQARSRGWRKGRDFGIYARKERAA